MDYFDYIKDLKPNDDLKSKTKARIQLEISKQNIKSRTAKRATISIAACLIILAVSVFTVKAVTKNSEYIDSTSETKTTLEQIISVHTTTDEAEEPQEILIGDTVYLQYQTKDKIEINKSDIGELIDRIGESNFRSEMKSLAEKKSSKKNKFQNAEVYRIKTYKNDTAVLVKEKSKEEYYLFYRTEQQ
ncbi:MAG: hypothetical protein K2K01_08410 [Eubacterium sp.]|nr:hypothetical protein [Eubacterium sp.]